MPSFISSRKRSRGEVGVHAAAVLTGLMGVLNFLSAILPATAARLSLLESLFPLEVRHGSRLAAALSAFALLTLSGGLWRRKRTAWLLTVVILAISMVSHLLKGLDFEEALVGMAILGWLWAFRAEFHARSDNPSIWAGLRRVTGAFAFTLLYGTIGFFFLDRHFHVTFSLGEALNQTVAMFVQFTDPGLVPVTRFGRYFTNSIYLVAAGTIGYGLLMLIRPVLLRRPASAQERDRAAAIVATHGKTPLARLTLLEDKHYFFSTGGSVIAFAQSGRVALALGDPIGPVEDLPAALGEFQETCRRHDWLPAFYQTLPETLPLYQKAGLSSLCIGQEAVLNLSEFSMEGRANKGLRSGVNKIQRLGYRADLVEPASVGQVLSELRLISDEWLSDHQVSEMRYSVGWFDDAYIKSCRVMLITHPEGRPVAFATLLPEYTRNEVSIDLMRFRSGLDNGVMDFLFASLFLWARDQGVDTFSLGLSALAGVGQDSQDPVLERAMHYLYQHTNRFYNFKGLHEFKDKFHPDWEPRYLIYPGPASLPMVAAALARVSADLPPLPFLKKRI